MDYKEHLQKLIKESNLTLREIADRCRELGQSIDPSYISKIQTGKLPPPSEEVSRVLAGVLGGDPTELIWHGYIEKAPKEIKQSLKNANPKFWIELVKDLGVNEPDEILKSLLEHTIEIHNQKKYLLYNYPEKPTIKQVREDAQLCTFHTLSDKELQRQLGCLYPDGDGYISTEDLLFVLSIEHYPGMSEEFKKRNSRAIEIAKRELIKRIPSFDEINELISKYNSLPEKDRKELLYLAELKNKLAQEKESEDVNVKIIHKNQIEKNTEGSFKNNKLQS